MLSRIHYGEYYPSFINTPGRIKYDFQEDFFTSLHINMMECPQDWSIEENTPETLRRSIPRTQRRFLAYNVILILKKELNGEIWYKIALQNPTDKTIAIITTTNSNENLRTRGVRNGVPTIEGNWVMARYRTTAHLYFWFEIKNRLLTNILDNSFNEVFE